MTFVMRRCVTVFTLWLTVGHVAAIVFSRNILKFTSILNGDYDNKAQYLSDTESHDFIQFRVVPVSTPALPDEAVVLIEWAFNRVILSLQLSLVHEGKNGAIFMTPYNFTDISNYTYGTFNFDVLSSLKPKDITDLKICQSEFEPTGDNSYMGTWPSCTHMINGKPALYADMLSCDDLRVVVPVSASEESSIDPYDMKCNGNRYPMVGAPPDFVNPCK